ncbi:hypothetical protein ASG69_11910 [Rhodococcus sp. Leaf225]|nr:hypothetical protein ASG69_11910 [Rhodococcus sp. Leaf225]KQU43616.1 hypothetical protein ASH03_13585 [Rhodococcus sp. Leaf258]
MRVEPRQCQAGEDRGPQRHTRSVPADGQTRRAQCPSEGHESVHGEEDGAGDRDDGDSRRVGLDDHADARDSREDEDRVGQSAHQDDGQHVLSCDALTENEGVLCADRDDEGEADTEADEQGGHDRNARSNPTM